MIDSNNVTFSPFFEKDLESYCSTIKDFETEILKYKSIIFQEFYKLYKVKLLQEAEIKIFEHRETLASVCP